MHKVFPIGVFKGHPTLPIRGSEPDIPSAIDSDGDGKADLALYGPDPAKPGHYRYLVLSSGSGYSAARAATFDNNGYGYGNGNATSIPVMADYEGIGNADFAVFTADGKGGMDYASQAGQGVVVDFATPTDIPLRTQAYLIARKVRGYRGRADPACAVGSPSAREKIV